MSREIPSRPSARQLLSFGSPVRRPRTSSPPRIPLAVNQISSLRWSLDEAVTELGRMGVQFIGLWRNRVEEFGIEKTQQILAEHRIRATSLSWAGGFTGSNGFSYDEAVQDVRNAVDMAAALGIPVVRVATGGRNSHTENHLRRIVIEGLREAGDYALRRHVLLAIQPMQPAYAKTWTFLSNLEQAFQLLDDCQHPAIRLGVGLQHIGLQPWALSQLQSRHSDLACVYVGDTVGPMESESDQCQLGSGQVPLQKLVQGLLHSGYTGPFEIEIWSEQLWSEANYETWLPDSIRHFQSLCR